LEDTLDATYYSDLSTLFDVVLTETTTTAGLSISGSTLTIDPQVGFVGTIRVTVNAADATATGTETFTVTVTASAPPVASRIVTAALRNLPFASVRTVEPFGRIGEKPAAGDGDLLVEAPANPAGGMPANPRLRSNLVDSLFLRMGEGDGDEDQDLDPVRRPKLWQSVWAAW
jgi:hypothetical protein